MIFPIAENLLDWIVSLLNLLLPKYSITLVMSYQAQKQKLEL